MRHILDKNKNMLYFCCQNSQFVVNSNILIILSKQDEKDFNCVVSALLRFV